MRYWSCEMTISVWKQIGIAIYAAHGQRYTCARCLIIGPFQSRRDLIRGKKKIVEHKWKYTGQLHLVSIYWEGTGFVSTSMEIEFSFTYWVHCEEIKKNRCCRSRRVYDNEDGKRTSRPDFRNLRHLRERCFSPSRRCWFRSPFISEKKPAFQTYRALSA